MLFMDLGRASPHTILIISGADHAHTYQIDCKIFYIINLSVYERVLFSEEVYMCNEQHQPIAQ